MSWNHPAVAVGAGLLALVIAVAIRTVGNQHMPRLMLWSTLTASVGMFGTTIGRLLRQATDGVLRLASQLIGSFTGVAVATALGVAVAGWLAYVVGIHLHRRKIDDRTLGAAILLPVVTVSIPGTVGAVLAYVVFVPANVLGALIAWLLHI